MAPRCRLRPKRARCCSTSTARLPTHTSSSSAASTRPHDRSSASPSRAGYGKITLEHRWPTCFLWFAARHRVKSSKSWSIVIARCNSASSTRFDPFPESGKRSTTCGNGACGSPSSPRRCATLPSVISTPSGSHGTSTQSSASTTAYVPNRMRSRSCARLRRSASPQQQLPASAIVR